MRTDQVKVLLREIRKNATLTSSCYSRGVNPIWSNLTDVTAGTWTCLTIRALSSDLTFSARRFFATNAAAAASNVIRSAETTGSHATASEAEPPDASPSKAAPFEAAPTEPSDHVMKTDADAARYLADILGRNIMSFSTSFPGVHPKREKDRKTLVAVEPGPGILIKHLLERYPNLDVRGTYRGRKLWSDSDDSLSAEFPAQYSANDANFWSAIIGSDSPETNVDLEMVFYGEEETYRRENERISRSPLKIRDGEKDARISASLSPSLSSSSSSSSSTLTSPINLFAFVKNSFYSRLMERLVDAIVEPEASLIGQFVPDSVFYFVLPVTLAPIDVLDILDELPTVESKTRGENLVLVTSKRFQRNKIQQKTRFVLMQTFYDVEALAAICPYVVMEASDFKKDKKSAYPYILVRVAAKNADEIVVKTKRRQSFALFVTTLCGAPEKRVIPNVEEYIPNMGPSMIMEGDFTMSELTKDLTLPRILKIFDMIAENPLYGESIYGLVESGHMSADEWLKKRLFIKRGFVKASLTN